MGLLAIATVCGGSMGCSGKDSAVDAAATPPAPAPQPAPQPASQPAPQPGVDDPRVAEFTARDLPAVAATVSLPLETRVVAEGFVIAATPKGWIRPKQWNDSGFSPTEPALGGADTLLYITSNCQGACRPKDWPRAAETGSFARHRAADMVREEERDLGDGRLVRSKRGARTYLDIARWAANAPRYYHCSVTLSGEKAAALVADMERLCLAARPVFLP